MKKLLVVLSLVTFCLMASNAAFACPKGQHPHGGTGSHHKGGYCSFD